MTSGAVPSEDDYISDDEQVLFCPQETVQRLLRLANHRFVLIERCIDVCTGPIHEGDGWDRLPFFLADLENLHHERYGVVLFELLCHGLLQDRPPSRTEGTNRQKDSRRLILHAPEINQGHAAPRGRAASFPAP
jgi:hypothetical protein